MKTFLHFSIVASLLLASCGAADGARPPLGGNRPPQDNDAPPGNAQSGDAPAPGNPSPQSEFVAQPVALQYQESPGDQPVYIYLFTHTEDHINHELSEARYTRLAPVVADLAASYPASELVWTIEFQGADAQTVAERDPVTGVATMLRDYAAQGYIDFGYHAHHEPTYFNRPQTELREGDSWEAIVQALGSWVSCEKDPLLGGCLSETGGGLLAVAEHFGPVQIVSGLSLETGDVGITGSAGRHALIQHMPDYMVDFGFSDHSPASREAGYSELVNELMDLLTPTYRNSDGLFWMDDALRINDAAVVDSIGLLNLDEGAASVAATMESMDRSHSQAMNAGFASKWIYTAQGSQSPTQYAYANPEDPELPPESINPPFLIEQNYQNNIDALSFLAAEFMPANPGSHFVGSEELLALAATAEYWSVSAAELDAIARWLLQAWGSAPPPYASDGAEFYSLRDAMGLLAAALTQQANRGLFPETQEITLFYGPLEALPPAEGLTLSLNEVYEIAAQVNRLLAASEEAWQLTPGNILPGSFTVAGGEINAAQALYALALVYASSYAGTPVDSVPLPATQPLPDTYEMLDTLGCWDCYDSAWSLKPATLH